MKRDRLFFIALAPLVFGAVTSQPARAAIYQAHVAGTMCTGKTTCLYTFPITTAPIEIHTISCLMSAKISSAYGILNGNLTYEAKGQNNQPSLYITTLNYLPNQATVYNLQTAFFIPSGAKPDLVFTATGNFSGNGDCMIEGTENP